MSVDLKEVKTVKVLVALLGPTLYNSIDYNLPGSSVHVIS